MRSSLSWEGTGFPVPIRTIGVVLTIRMILFEFEIEAALKRDVRVIPVLVDGAVMPRAGELPDCLKGLARRQGSEVSPARLDADVEKLTHALSSILERRRARDAVEASRPAEEERRALEAPQAERAAREERNRRELHETTGSLADRRFPLIRRTDDISVGLKLYYRELFAVVIGINEYKSPSVPGLRYASSGVDDVTKILPMLGFPEKNVQILKGENATRYNINHAIYDNMKNMTEEDRLLIFFAGHGVVSRTPDGEEGYLLPYDADLNRLATSTLPMFGFSRIGRALPAKHILLVLDSCFSGFFGGPSSAASSPEEELDEKLRNRVVEVLTAGTSGQQAGEERGSGLFTKAFVEGLKGAADPKGRGLTALKLAFYIKECLQGTPQSPHFAKLEGEGEFLFLPPV